MSIQVVANLHNILSRQQFHAIALRLLDDTLGKLSARHTFGEPGVVVEALGNTGLSTQAAALDHQHVIPITRCIDRRGKRRRPTTHGDQVVKLTLCLRL